MNISDIETTVNAESGWRDWTAVHLVESPVAGTYISIRSEYQAPGGQRETWEDAGITLDVAHIDWLIGALEEAKRALDEKGAAPEDGG